MYVYGCICLCVIEITLESSYRNRVTFAINVNPVFRVYFGNMWLVYSLNQPYQMLPTNLPQRKQIKRVKRTPGQFRKMQLKLFSTWISTLLGKKWYCFRDLFFLGKVGLEPHFCYCRKERSSTSDPKEKKEQPTTNTKAKKGPHTKGRKWKDPHKHTRKNAKAISATDFFLISRFGSGWNVKMQILH